MESRVLAEAVGDAPAGAYTLPLHVRSYEVMRGGCVSPATILRYLEYIATEASAYLGFDHVWYETHGSAWVVREMSLLLAHLPGIDDELVLATWLSEYRRVQAFREYAIWDARTGRRVARARARWAYIDRYRGTPMRVHDELLARFPMLGHTIRTRQMRSGDAAAASTSMRYADLTTREYEADTQQHINNCVYVDWLYDALGAALSATPEPLAGRTARPRWYHIEYARPTLPGDAVRIATTVRPAGARMLTAVQEITNRADGAATVRAYSEHLLTARPPAPPLAHAG